MTKSPALTPLATFAALAHAACLYHADAFAPATFEPYASAHEPYISDSTIDETTASLDAISILTMIMTDDYRDERIDEYLAALRDHTRLADLPAELKLIIPDATYPDDYCICDTIPFRYELITNCPHDDSSHHYPLLDT